MVALGRRIFETARLKADGMLLECTGCPMNRNLWWMYLNSRFNVGQRTEDMCKVVFSNAALANCCTLIVFLNSTKKATSAGDLASE